MHTHIHTAWLEPDGTSLFTEGNILLPSLGQQKQLLPISQDEGTTYVVTGQRFSWLECLCDKLNGKVNGGWSQWVAFVRAGAESLSVVATLYWSALWASDVPFVDWSKTKCALCQPFAGCLESVDWTTGMEYWNGLNCFFLTWQLSEKWLLTQSLPPCPV